MTSPPPPSSPPFRLRLSLSPSSPSSCSSTMVMTPAPLSLPSFCRGPPPKGALQPHVSNLPRRQRRRAPLATLRISAPPITTRARTRSASPSSLTPSPIQIPSLPALPFPISAPPQRLDMDMDGMDVDTGAVGSGPTHANVPRRAKALTAARRRRERCMQELPAAVGWASGVFVAFESESHEDDEGEAEFGAVVRITTADDDVDDVSEEDNGRRLRLVVLGARDDGVPSLRPSQLRAACAFVRGRRDVGRRVLIIAPRDNAVDAFSVGVGACSAHLPDCWDEGDANDDDDTTPERVHRLLSRWHDLPVLARHGEEDKDGGDDDAGLGGGLRDEWRGLLSRDGVEYLADALASTSPSPSPPPLP